MYLYDSYRLGALPVYENPKPHPAVDSWTFVHALTGLAFGVLGVPPVLALAGAVVYEMIEADTNIRPAFFLSKQPEGPANVAMDLLVFAAGLAVGMRAR